MDPAERSSAWYRRRKRILETNRAVDYEQSLFFLFSSSKPVKQHGGLINARKLGRRQKISSKGVGAEREKNRDASLKMAKLLKNFVTTGNQIYCTSSAKLPFWIISINFE